MAARAGLEPAHQGSNHPPLPLGYRALVELEDLAECCNDAVAPGLCHRISYLMGVGASLATGSL
jgi:hypothetical protein